MAGNADRWWRVCPGCGRQRRLAVLAPAPERMTHHNRWDPQARQMVRCEGSGQPPAAGKSGEEGAA